MIPWAHHLNIVRHLPTLIGLLLCVLLSTAATGQTQHNETIAVGDTDHYELGGSISILEDASGQLSIDEARARLSEYAHSQSQTPNFGQSQSAFWLHFSLSNSTEEQLLWYLRYAHSMVDKIDFYSFRNGQLITHQRGGASMEKRINAFLPVMQSSRWSLNPMKHGTIFCA